MSVVPTVRSEASTPSTAVGLDKESAPATQSDEASTFRVAEQGAVCTLELVENPEVKFQVRDGQTIGRSNRADIELAGVPGREYVSRIHARFFRRGEQWFAQYVATGNFIKVDGETYEDDSEVALENGSMLTLSMTTFRVHLN